MDQFILLTLVKQWQVVMIDANNGHYDNNDHLTLCCTCTAKQAQNIARELDIIIDEILAKDHNKHRTKQIHNAHGSDDSILR